MGAARILKRHGTVGGATIWVDVEDFLAYFTVNPRPSGIQRLSFEIMRSLVGLIGAGRRLRFARRGVGDGALEEVAWGEVERVFHAPPPPAPKVVAAPPPEPPLNFDDFVTRLPPELRAPLHRSRVLQRGVGGERGGVAGAVAAGAGGGGGCGGAGAG